MLGEQQPGDQEAGEREEGRDAEEAAAQPAVVIGEDRDHRQRRARRRAPVRMRGGSPGWSRAARLAPRPSIRPAVRKCRAAYTAGPPAWDNMGGGRQGDNVTTTGGPEHSLVEPALGSETAGEPILDGDDIVVEPSRPASHTHRRARALTVAIVIGVLAAVGIAIAIATRGGSSGNTHVTSSARSSSAGRASSGAEVARTSGSRRLRTRRRRRRTSASRDDRCRSAGGHTELWPSRHRPWLTADSGVGRANDARDHTDPDRCRPRNHRQCCDGRRPRRRFRSRPAAACFSPSPS